MESKEEEIQAAPEKIPEGVVAKFIERRVDKPSNDKLLLRFIAMMILVLYCYVQWYIVNEIIAAEMREIAMRSLGNLDAIVGLILGYYYREN